MKATLVFECEVPDGEVDAWCDAFHYAFCALQGALDRACNTNGGGLDECADVFKEINFE